MHKNNIRRINQNLITELSIWGGGNGQIGNQNRRQTFRYIPFNLFFKVLRHGNELPIQIHINI